MLELEHSRVFVAGGSGMVGSAILRKLTEQNCEVLAPSSADLDLRDKNAVDSWFFDHKPQVVFVAAAKVGGIAANDSKPVAFLSDNLAIAHNTIVAAHDSGVRKLVFLGSSCVYPKHAVQPIKEDALLSGALEPTNEWYAIAKIAGIKLCQAHRKEFGRDFVSVMPCNLYGPNDNFDLETSHVLPALLRKAHEAKLADMPLTVWGSGKPLREFLYVDDAADAAIFAAMHYSDALPLNAGFGQEISIAALAQQIARTVDYTGELQFDATRPDGTLRKLMDSSRINQLGWCPTVSLEQGLESTYAWFLKNVV